MSVTKGLIILLVFVGAVLSAGYFSMGDSTPEAGGDAGLYDRLGEKEGITEIVRDFIFKVAGDYRVKTRFAYIDMPRFRKLMIEQICEATGGPCTYSGRSMSEAHQGMDISEKEFKIVAEKFAMAMEAAQVGQEDQATIMNLLEGMRDDIVGQ